MLVADELVRELLQGNERCGEVKRKGWTAEEALWGCLVEFRISFNNNGSSLAVKVTFSLSRASSVKSRKSAEPKNFRNPGFRANQRNVSSTEDFVCREIWIYILGRLAGFRLNSALNPPKSAYQTAPLCWSWIWREHLKRERGLILETDWRSELSLLGKLEKLVTCDEEALVLNRGGDS
ncbi:hypothetical protein MA16_Dca013666 [Dendrobium catenatum]|uniref:Uncharacterized protein n=1 Tax=Dendrobium catenatum TaxID=906689 RepID=A0A2I0WPF6_9ASPA|nr:hypothetical protein MA16_Dca013666 [Dendrobium catenatum]